jgi:hypothetical protein
MGGQAFTTSVRVAILFFTQVVSSGDKFRPISAVAHPTTVKPSHTSSKNFFS